MSGPPARAEADGEPSGAAAAVPALEGEPAPIVQLEVDAVDVALRHLQAREFRLRPERRLPQELPELPEAGQAAECSRHPACAGKR